MSGEIVVTVRGHLAADAVVKLVAGHEVAELRVASGVRRKQGGEWIDVRTDWSTVTVWKDWLIGQAAQLKKGQKVRIEGRLKPSAYIGQDGEAHASVEVSADEISVFLKTPVAESAAGQKAAKAA